MKNQVITKDRHRKSRKELNAEASDERLQELENRKTKDFSAFEKIRIILFWWKYVFWGSNFKKEGYKLREKRKWQLVAIGASMYFTIFLLAYEAGKAIK